jgi:hypothetical protein
MYVSQNEVSQKIEAEVQQMDPEVVREAVVSHMYRNGENRWRLNEDQWETIYLTCDGFGSINAKFANEQCWDWSHVRDSSEKAFCRAWTIINIWHIEGELRTTKDL